MYLFIKKLFLPFLLVLLASCSAIYQPNSLNIPILGKKSEGTLIVGTGSNTFEVQSAYAITDNYAIMLNYSKTNNNDRKKFKQNLGEFAVGYFNLFNKTKVVEIYLGGGYGESSSLGSSIFMHIVDTTLQTNSAFYRFFIQTNYGIKGKVVEAGIALRASFLHFKEIKINGLSGNKLNDNFLVAPALFLRIGGPVIKLKAQISFSSLLSSSNLFLYEPLIISVGIVLRIGS